MKTLLYIGNKLQQANNTVSTIDTLSKNLEKEGYRVITASSKKNKTLRLLDMLWHIFKYKKSVDYVLIDTYSTLNFFYAFYSSKLCKSLSLKYIPILHGGDLPLRLKTSPKLSKAIFNNAYLNIAPSNYIKSNFENLGYTNIMCIPNSIEIKKYPFKLRTIDTPKLLWVRAFSKIYNPFLAIKIASVLKEEYTDVELCMVGPDKDGSFSETKKLAQHLGVNVRFTGKLSKNEWIKLSKDYNTFINTTTIDNMPVSVIEAMALGLPIVSTNVGGLPFLIQNDVNGILVEPNSIEQFATAISRLAKNANASKELSFKALSKVQQLDWEVVKHQWFSILS